MCQMKASKTLKNFEMNCILKLKVCQEKKQTDIFLNNTKVIAPTVKTQARGQNNLFRALK